MFDVKDFVIFWGIFRTKRKNLLGHEYRKIIGGLQHQQSTPVSLCGYIVNYLKLTPS